MLGAHELLEGLASVRIRDHHRCGDALAIVENDPRGPAVLDLDATDGTLQQELAACGFESVHQRVCEALEATFTVVRAVSDVTHQHRGPIEEGDPRRGQPEG